MAFINVLDKWKHFSYRLKSRKQKFSKIYENYGFSGEGFPMSGIGSSLPQTEQIRQKLPFLFNEYGIGSFVDAPCGDFTWLKMVNLDGLRYRGLDIVKQAPPHADLILCRDCFVHLSNRDVLKALSNFKKSGSTYLLTTTFICRSENVDLVSGRGWRPINLQKQPYNFPGPLLLIDEACTEADGRFADKALGLWLIKDLPW